MARQNRAVVRLVAFSEASFSTCGFQRRRQCIDPPAPPPFTVDIEALPPRKETRRQVEEG